MKSAPQPGRPAGGAQLGGAMGLLRSTILAAGLALGLAAPAFAAHLSPPALRLDPGKMIGRWYEIARVPNHTQRGCQGGTSDWARTEYGFHVVQTCHKGSLAAPPTEWTARAKVVDPATNARFEMSFFGGLVTQEYWVLENRADQGWLILGTPEGKYLWLMSQRPNLAAGIKAEAVARIKQLGYDASILEFPLPARN